MTGSLARSSECRKVPANTGGTWTPIDGTQSFIRGIPLFGTMVGLEGKGEAVAGVIVFPALKELIFAGKGLGAWWCDDLTPHDRKKAYVSKVSRLSEACLSTNSAIGFERIGREAAYRKLSAAAGVSRGYPDCYGHYLVATGRIEIMIDPVVSAWDNAPLQPIMEEAGGRFTDLGRETPLFTGAAAYPAMAQCMMRWLLCSRAILSRAQNHNRLGRLLA